MKTLNIYVVILFSIFASSSFAQKSTVLNTKEQIKVWGNCETCKKRIETAAISAGAVTAYWSDQSHMLAVSFDGAKTSSEKIQKAIAASGYDTQDFKGIDEVYNNLPSCCKYERNTAFANTTAKMNCGNMDCCKDNLCCKGKCSEANCKDIPECKTMTCCKS
jgi:hypothetical protein